MDSREAERTVASLAREAPDPGAAAELLATIELLSDSPLYKDCAADLLIDGPATYQAMLEAIRSAESYVYLETYIFADDAVGDRFAEALIERSRAGADVRVIFDSFGSRDSEAEFFDRLRQAGVEAHEYNVINPARGGNPLDANTRNHRKLLIVDGAIAFTGGINLSRYYAKSSTDADRSGPLSPGWRDTHVAIRGPAVTGFEGIFAANWEDVCELDSCALTTSEDKEKAGNDVVAVLEAEGGDGVESAIYLSYLEAMRLAKEKIWISQAYFAPDDRFMSLLKDAAARGVDVRLIVPAYSDTNVVVHASRSRYGELLTQGIRIFETTTTVLHAKTAVIDGIWSTVGSSNLDYRSFLHNHEVNAVIFGSDFGSQMERQFEEDLAAAREVALSEWENRPLLDRVKEFWSWTVEYWL